MINVKVTLNNGDYFTTGINCDLQGAKDYYLGKFFNFGIEGDLMLEAVLVEEV